MRHRSVCVFLLVAAVSAGCAAEEQPPIKAAPPRLPAHVPSSAPPEGKLVTAEVPPDLIEKMRADLAQRVGIEASAAKVTVAESIVWPNGAIGCPQPGRMYTQALVPGYRVELEYQGKKYAYHATKNGSFQYCANAMPVPASSAQ